MAEVRSAPTVELYFRCSDEEHARLLRRQEGRDGPSGERIGQRLGRALDTLCDEVETGGLTIETSEATARLLERQRKARVPSSIVERMSRIVDRLPGVSRDQFVREAIRRFTKLY